MLPDISALLVAQGASSLSLRGAQGMHALGLAAELARPSEGGGGGQDKDVGGQQRHRRILALLREAQAARRDSPEEGGVGGGGSGGARQGRVIEATATFAAPAVQGGCCAACGVAGAGRKCPCKAVVYCGTNCQKAHWKSHKPDHKRLVEKQT